MVRPRRVPCFVVQSVPPCSLFIATPALADAKADAIAACAAELKRSYGVSADIVAKFQASGSGTRIDVSGNAPYQGNNSRVVCKTNNGRVTSVIWG